MLDNDIMAYAYIFLNEWSRIPGPDLSSITEIIFRKKKQRKESSGHVAQLFEIRFLCMRNWSLTLDHMLRGIKFEICCLNGTTGLKGERVMKGYQCPRVSCTLVYSLSPRLILP